MCIGVKIYDGDLIIPVVHIDAGADAVYFAGTSVLPALIGSAVSDLLVILSNPNIVVGQLAHIELIVEPTGAGVNHRRISLGFYLLAERLNRFGSLGLGKSAAGGSRTGQILRVDNNRIGDIDAGFLNLLDAEIGFFLAFLRINRFCKEVDAHIDSGGFRALDVSHKSTVGVQLAVGAAAVTAANDSELHAGGFHLLPVDFVLEIGYIDSDGFTGIQLDNPAGGCGLVVLSVHLERSGLNGTGGGSVVAVSAYGDKLILINLSAGCGIVSLSVVINPTLGGLYPAVGIAVVVLGSVLEDSFSQTTGRICFIGVAGHLEGVTPLNLSIGIHIVAVSVVIDKSRGGFYHAVAVRIEAGNGTVFEDAGPQSSGGESLISLSF